MKNKEKTTNAVLVMYRIKCWCVDLDNNRLPFLEVVCAENFEEAKQIVSKRFRQAGLMPVTGYRRDILNVIYLN
jgi:hypothetical protein